MTFRFPLAEHWSSYYCEHLSTKQTLTSFTVEPFNIYFEDLMWLFTHLWRLDKQDRRLKISLPWHLTSSLKTFPVESNIFTNICVVVKLQHIRTITLHTRTFDSESFGYWNTRLTLAWFRSSLVVSLCTQEPPPLQLSSGAAEQFHIFNFHLIDPNIDKVFRHDVWSQLASRC